MKRDIILGFASCALGLLPLLAGAQTTSPIGCQADAAAQVVGGGTSTLPLIVNNGAQHLIICGYGISASGASTGIAQLYSGFGSACATQGSLTQTVISVQVPGGQTFERTAMAYVLPYGASVCLNSNASTTEASAEVNYSFQ